MPTTAAGSSAGEAVLIEPQQHPGPVDLDYDRGGDTAADHSGWRGRRKRGDRTRWPAFPWLLLGHMPPLALGVLASLAARPWPTRLAMIIGFLLLGIDSALIVNAVINALAQGSNLSWLVVLFDAPGVIVLAGVWLMSHTHAELKAIAPPPTGEWR